ncbi:hypothetical protein AB0L75_21370 [Streptomyces sp. NPDC052101]|uniref:NACHT domain-containing protein n=1 Tax=Streptomyces sp. NPDC052101 TaxID=3155763 RepID=UPI0034293EFB
MAAPTVGPVADFCSELHRLVVKCGVSQREISEALGWSSTSSVSELLSGQRRRVPDWDVVRKIVGLCAEKGLESPPPGMSLNIRYWKSRHAELERTAETARGRTGRACAPTASSTAPRLDATECVEMGVEEAVRLLREGIGDAASIADTLTTAPPGWPNAPRTFALDLLSHFPARVRAAHGLERAALIQAARVVLVAAAVTETGAAIPEEARELILDLADGWHVAHTDPLAYRDSLEADRDEHITQEYLRLATPLAKACPEFTLAALPGAAEDSGAVGTGLAGLGNLLSDFTGRERGSTPRGALLRDPIASLDSPGPRLPSLAEGYVTPGFRLAGPGRSARSGIASDKWWDEQPLHDCLERFLAAHFLGLPALLAPLVVLGHPGAGKSLLTKLLKERLPAAEFRPLRVELRHTPADADLQTQLEHTLKRDTGRETSWPDWSEESSALPVVLLDGFDELLQASAQRLDQAHQWGYLQEIKEFQRREAGQGRPLVVLVTSRTVVADRAELPYTSTVIRLEPFDEPKIEHWLGVWNAKNAGFFTREGLLPLTPEVVLPHLELAAQPLLLLMLALYDAVDNALNLMRDQDISRTELYDRLLREFVRRQVDKDGPLPPTEATAAVDRELHRLSVIALSMFHRGAQAISGEEADGDLRALGEADDSSGLLFGRFFFVHEAQAVVTEERLRSYEFMHATFGEHLAARLIEGALRRLDDGELYALLSFAPLTDRAQLVQNLRDMLATDPTDRARTVLVPALFELFRAAEWDPERTTATGYAPVRLRRAYRDAVYEVNLLLLAVLAAGGEVVASELLGAENETTDTVAVWRRHALGWQGQLSRESWAALTSFFRPERFRHADPGGPDDQKLDLRITTRRAPLADHSFDWMVVRPSSPEAGMPLSDRLEQRISLTAPDTMNTIRQSLFTCDFDTELLLHTGYPLLLQWPRVSTEIVHFGKRVHSPTRPLVALLTRDVYAADALPALYGECLDVVGSMTPDECSSYLEAVLCHLAQDAPALPDEALAFVLHHLGEVTLDRGVSFTEAMDRALLVCLCQALDRGSPRLTGAVDAVRNLVSRYDGTAEQALLALTRLSRSTHGWRWSGPPRGEDAAFRFDVLIADLDLPSVATTHPSALIDLLRLAAELGLTGWLADHAAEILAALPAPAFGLLRPSDLPYLRAALPPGAHAERFEEVEQAWRGPGTTSP